MIATSQSSTAVIRATLSSATTLLSMALSSLARTIRSTRPDRTALSAPVDEQQTAFPMTIIVDSGVSATVNCPISNEGELVKSGAGTLVIAYDAGSSSPPSITAHGGMRITDGTLELHDGAAIAAPNIRVEEDGTLSVPTGATATLKGHVVLEGGEEPADISFSTGCLVFDNFEDGQGSHNGLEIARPCTLDGGTLDLGGTLHLTEYDIVIACEADDVTVASGTLMNVGEIKNSESQPVALNKTGPGTLYLLGTNTYTGNTEINGGTLQLGNSEMVGTIIGTVTAHDGITVILDVSSGQQEYDIDYQGDRGLVKIGGGTAILWGDENTYTGGTEIQEGTLQVGDSSHTSSLGTGNVAISANAKLALNSPVGGSIDNNIHGAGDLVINGSSAVTVRGDNTFSGTTRVQSGQLKIGSRDALRGSTLDTYSMVYGRITIDEPNVTEVCLGGIKGSQSVDFLDADVHIVGKNPDPNDNFTGYIRTTGALWIDNGAELQLGGNNAGCLTTIYVSNDSTLRSTCSCAWGNSTSTIYAGPSATLTGPASTAYAQIVEAPNLYYVLDSAPIEECPLTYNFTTPNVDPVTLESSFQVNVLDPSSGCNSCQTTGLTFVIQSGAADPDFGNGYGVMSSRRNPASSRTPRAERLSSLTTPTSFASLTAASLRSTRPATARGTS